MITDVDRISRLEEHPVFFPAGGETLFGVFSTSRPDRSPTGVITLGGGGTTPTTTERNRFFVSLCRRLTHVGYATFRFDYHGLGDSTGTATFRLDRPFVGDLKGAIRWLGDQGIAGYLLVGSCFGARTALAAGPALRGLRGVVLLAPPLRDYALSEPKTAGWSLRDYALVALRPRRLLGQEEPLTPQRYGRFVVSGARLVGRRLRDRLPGRRGEPSWVSRRFLDPLGTMADRGVPILIVYGTRDAEYADFEIARRGGLGEALGRWPSVTIETLEGQVHAFTRIASQASTTELIVDWIRRSVPTDRTP